MGVRVRIWNRVFSAIRWARRIAAGVFIAAAGDWVDTGEDDRCPGHRKQGEAGLAIEEPVAVIEVEERVHHQQ